MLKVFSGFLDYECFILTLLIYIFSFSYNEPLLCILFVIIFIKFIIKKENSKYSIVVNLKAVKFNSYHLTVSSFYPTGNHSYMFLGSLVLEK